MIQTGSTTQLGLYEFKGEVENAIKKFENTGGMISRATLSELNATTPEYDYQLARVDETGDEYRWNPLATPSPAWEATGRNFLNESKDFTLSSIFKSTTGGYVSSNNKVISGFFINTGNAQVGLGSAYFVTSSVAIMSVKPSTKYLVSSGNYSPSGFVFGESDNDDVFVGKNFSKLTLTEIESGVYVFTTSPTTNYVVTNFLLETPDPTFTYDNTQVSVLSSGEILVNNLPVVKSESLITLQEYGVDREVNLNDSAVVVEGKVINIDNGNIIDFAAFTMHQIPVVSGQKYNFKCDNYLSNAFVFAFRTTNDTTAGSTVGYKTVNDLYFKEDNSFDFTVPSGMNYMLYNVFYASDNSFDIRTTTEIFPYGNVSKVIGIENKSLVDLEVRDLVAEFNSNLLNKKWLAIGDSITDYSFRPYPTYKNFTQQLSEKYNMTVYNYGQSGTGFYGRYNVADTITQLENDIDFITVFMGTNDWGNIQVVPNNKPLGVFGDTGTSTIAGCMNQTFSGLIAKFPKTPIYVFTPLPRFDAFGVNPPLNVQGYRLSELVDLLKLYAKQYSLRVLDFYLESNFRCQTTAMKDISTVGGDGVHPTGEAHTNLLPIIEGFLKSCAK